MRDSVVEPDALQGVKERDSLTVWVREAEGEGGGGVDEAATPEGQ
jgi:hypothetical protein